MAGFEDLLNVLTNVRGSLNNLSKDVDEKDPREKTDQDLATLHMNFDDLLTIFRSMEESDLQAIYREVTELASGQETFQQYISDVSKILQNIKNKAAKNDATSEKIQQNLPRNLQDQDPEELFKNYQETVNNLIAWGKQLQQTTKQR